jgi:hypothetical protein
MTKVNRHETVMAANPRVVSAHTALQTHDAAYGGNQLYAVIPSSESAASSAPSGTLTFNVPLSTSMTALSESFIVVNGYYASASIIPGAAATLLALIKYHKNSSLNGLLLVSTPRSTGGVRTSCPF